MLEKGICSIRLSPGLEGANEISSTVVNSGRSLPLGQRKRIAKLGNDFIHPRLVIANGIKELKFGRSIDIHLRHLADHVEVVNVVRGVDGTVFGQSGIHGHLTSQRSVDEMTDQFRIAERMRDSHGGCLVLEAAGIANQNPTWPP